MDNVPKTGVIKKFFESSFVSFLKNYFFFIILFSICFYILINVFNDTNNHITVYETKVLFCLVIAFLFIIINDLMSIPLQWLDKFFIVIILSLIVEYIIIHIIENIYKNEPFHKKLFKVCISSVIVGLIFAINIFFMFQLKDKSITSQLFNSFNYAIGKNYLFFIFLTFNLFFFYYTYYFLNFNSFLGDILSPTILGSIVLFIIFSFIVYVILKLKIINKLQILNSFISLFSLLFFLIIVFIYIFMNSISTICTSNESLNSVKQNDYMTILILVSIFIILWYDDSRNWHQKGSILFIFATIITFYSFFYYSIQNPNMSLLSLWLFIEWLIIFFKRNENSKNSFNFAFMKT
jgi:hypothetical protein